MKMTTGSLHPSAEGSDAPPAAARTAAAAMTPSVAASMTGPGSGACIVDRRDTIVVTACHEPHHSHHAEGEPGAERQLRKERDSPSSAQPSAQAYAKRRRDSSVSKFGEERRHRFISRLCADRTVQPNPRSVAGTSSPVAEFMPIL
jgi:hypothetical protein